MRAASSRGRPFFRVGETTLPRTHTLWGSIVKWGDPTATKLPFGHETFEKMAPTRAPDASAEV